ncbi:hypothetical protein MINT15_37660 [Saccharomonospora viridis]|uniref:Uncharacterized protein n=1 Tax=Saccharomonospora viridis TaxID=1852 RepID=A0A837DB20_9PSEU|nr:hypothetical protein MINT15_37660 [Saccharomonospora viridis]
MGLESNIVRSPARGLLHCHRCVSDRGCVCDRVPRLRRSQASNEESDRPDTESGRGRSSTPEFRTGRHRAPRAWTTRATASRKAHTHGPTAASGKNRPGVKPSATQRTPRAVRCRYFFDPHPSIRTSDPAPERSRPRR